MARWSYRRPQLARVEGPTSLEEDGPVIFTKRYVKHTLLSKKEYPPGVEGMIVNWHTGPLGGVTHVNIRLADGEFVNNVPVEYFRAA